MSPCLAGPQAIVKRGFDLSPSILLLVLLFLLLLLTALAIKTTSRGPIFFIQERVGKAGQVYRLIKFRSMVDGAEHQHDDVLGIGSTTPTSTSWTPHPRWVDSFVGGRWMNCRSC